MEKQSPVQQKDAIQVAKGTKLIITDCQKVVGKITHAHRII